MNISEIKIRIIYFFKKYKRVIILVFVVWLIIFLINQMLKNRKVEPEPTTTYDMHTSIINTDSSTPKSIQNIIEEYIKNYVDNCNNGNYQKAFDMLSYDCQKYEFHDSVEEFMTYVLVKMPLPKKYFIQDYSNIKLGNTKVYIYEIKYTDDLLATGLTNSTYTFTSEKIAFYEDTDGNLVMNIGDYIYHSDIKNISENEYLKIDIIDKVVKYNSETYYVKITNRSNYTVVIADGAENNEIILNLPNEYRNCNELENIVLKPGEEISTKFSFIKFVDDGDTSNSISFSSIRVMEQYSGNYNIDQQIVQNEIDNAISKFSMEVDVTE